MAFLLAIPSALSAVFSLLHLPTQFIELPVNFTWVVAFILGLGILQQRSLPYVQRVAVLSIDNPFKWCIAMYTFRLSTMQLVERLLVEP